MNAIHLICRRDESGKLKYVILLDRERHLYQSGFWDISSDEADMLKGGWVYLHDKKSNPSDFGGRIVSWTQVAHAEVAHEVRICLEFEAHKAGGGQRWRGKDHGMAWTGGLVSANFAHEMVTENANRT